MADFDKPLKINTPPNLPKLVVTAHPPVTGKQQSRLFQSIESYVSGVQREDWVPSPGLQAVWQNG